MLEHRHINFDSNGLSAWKSLRHCFSLNALILGIQTFKVWQEIRWIKMYWIRCSWNLFYYLLSYTMFLNKFPKGRSNVANSRYIMKLEIVLPEGKAVLTKLVENIIETWPIRKKILLDLRWKKAGFHSDDKYKKACRRKKNKNFEPADRLI